jgi:hypothetical protein
MMHSGFSFSFWGLLIGKGFLTVYKRSNHGSYVNAEEHVSKILFNSFINGAARKILHLFKGKLKKHRYIVY